MPLRFLRRAAPMLALLALAACGDSDDGPTTPVTPTDTVPSTGPTATLPVTLPVLGQGAISGRYSAEVWVHNGIAYTTTWGNRGGNRGNTIYVWNAAGAQPALLDSVRVESASTLGDVEVSRDGRYLLVAQESAPTGAFLLYSLADPRRPELIVRHATAATRNGVHTAELEEVGGRLYAFLAIDPAGVDPAALVIVDLSEPALPREVFAQSMGRPYMHDVFVRDGYLFTANWDDGLVVWGIGAGGVGSPESPVRLGSVATTGGDVHNVWWFHDPSNGSRRYVFVGEEGPGGASSFSSSGDVHVVDLIDPRNPREVAFFNVAGAGTHNFWVDEARGVLYAAYYNGGVRALNVRGDLGSCTDAQRSDADRGPGVTMLCDLAKMGRAVGVGLAEPGRGAFVWGVQQVGNALYASDMHKGLWKLDLAPLYSALGR